LAVLSKNTAERAGIIDMPAAPAKEAPAQTPAKPVDDIPTVDQNSAPVSDVPAPSSDTAPAKSQ